MVPPKCLLLRESPIMVGQCSQMVELGSIWFSCFVLYSLCLSNVNNFSHRQIESSFAWYGWMDIAPNDIPSKDAKWCVNCECIYNDLRLLIACVHDWSICENWIQIFLGWKRMHRVKNSLPHTLDSEGNSWSQLLFLLMCSFLWLPCNYLCHFFIVGHITSTMPEILKILIRHPLAHPLNWIVGASWHISAVKCHVLLCEYDQGQAITKSYL